ncbi:unnamed protein product [Heterosigma akashiwo]
MGCLHGLEGAPRVGRYDHGDGLHVLWQAVEVDGDRLLIAFALAGAIVPAVDHAAVAGAQLVVEGTVHNFASSVKTHGLCIQIDWIHAIEEVPTEPKLNNLVGDQRSIVTHSLT